MGDGSPEPARNKREHVHACPHQRLHLRAHLHQQDANMHTRIDTKLKNLRQLPIRTGPKDRQEKHGSRGDPFTECRKNTVDKLRFLVNLFFARKTGFVEKHLSTVVADETCIEERKKGA